MNSSEAARSAIERLEQRRLLSGSASLVGDDLQITGTAGRDVIVVSFHKDDPAALDVRIGHKEFSFDADAVSSITVNALGGNDKVSIKEKRGVIYADCVIDAGAGNDSVATGSGNDIVEGGDGNDRISGGAGDDVLVGAAGNDHLMGGDNDDQLDAGDGKDKLNGAGGDDNLDGGAGVDSIVAGDGSNRVAVDEAHPAEVHDKDQTANSSYELAARRISDEREGQTLQGTALVHEAYLRLVGTGQPQQWNSRGHFFAAAAEAMRRILVESARRRQALRRGGDLKRVELDAIQAVEPPTSDDVLSLNDALEKLAAIDSAKAELVKLRYFAGLTMEEAAGALGISPATAHRHWNYARAWLHREIGGQPGASKES